MHSLACAEAATLLSVKQVPHPKPLCNVSCMLCTIGSTAGCLLTHA